MVFFKRLVSGLLYPLPLSLLIISTGLVLLWFTKKQAAGRILATAGFLILMVCSYWPAAAALIAPLEDDRSAVSTSGMDQSIRSILVLNGGVIADETHPAASRLGGSTLVRLVEGVRLAHALPTSVLYCTAPDEGVGGAMWQVARELGVEPARIHIVTTGGDTASEADSLKPHLTEEPFLLVTSAAHMGRALATFRSRGLDPRPAAADFRALRRDGFTLDYFIPTERALDMSTRAIHEYFAHLWRFTGGR